MSVAMVLDWIAADRNALGGHHECPIIFVSHVGHMVLVIYIKIELHLGQRSGQGLASYTKAENGIAK